MDYGKLALKRIEELYLDFYGLRAEMAKHVGNVSSSLSGEGEDAYSSEVSFRSGEGNVTLTLFINSSIATSAEIYLDGESLGAYGFASGGSRKELDYSGVSSGVHTVRVKVSGDEAFTLSSLSLTVTGNVYLSDGDVFIEGFPDCNAYLRLSLGKLEIFSFDGGQSTLLATLYGIAAARAAFCGGMLVIAVTEGGTACVIDFSSGYGTPVYIPLKDGASYGCGVGVGEDVEIFVSSNGGVERFTYSPSTSAVQKGGAVNVSAGDMLALTDGGKLYLVSQRGGFISVGVQCESKSVSPRIPLIL